MAACLAVAAGFGIGAVISRARTGHEAQAGARSAAFHVGLIAAVRAVRIYESRLHSGHRHLTQVFARRRTAAPERGLGGRVHGKPGRHDGPAPAAAAPRLRPACFRLPGPPASCSAPHLFQVAYGIQPLLERGIDGRGETVTVLASPPSRRTPLGPPPTPRRSPRRDPATTDIRQDLAAFDSEFRLPAARVQVVTSLAGAASPWQAADQEVQDVEIVHVVAPAATLRVVLLPSNALASAANATAGMLAGLRLAVSGTDVALIGWSLGEHFFTKAQAAQLHSILLGAAAHHVTVVAGSGDNGGFSDGSGARRSRRSAFRPPTRSCWPLAAPRSPRIPRPAPTPARPPGMATPAFREPAEHRGAASAACMPVPPIRMASRGSRP